MHVNAAGAAVKHCIEQVFRCGLFAFVLAMGVAACDSDRTDIEPISTRSLEEQIGTRFSSLTAQSFQAPSVEKISLAFPSEASAIWGAIGRDDDGHIYLGASTHAGENKTAYLARYNPNSGQISYQGDTVGQLKRLGLHLPGMGQNKLHSKFYQADDGFIYFASFDEQGESSDRNPAWGGHLWRKRPDATEWEHVTATKEALIAVNVSGQYVYTLGYWDHVLYQYNMYTDKIATIVVGSVPGHISRNFLVDLRGHVYVPRVSLDSDNQLTAVLNEYDTRLSLVGAYPMPSYTAKKAAGHHGIVGYTSMKNGDIVFSTSDGGLYYLKTSLNGGTKLEYRGMMHPEGKAYIASVFPMDGFSYLAAAARVPKQAEYDWVVYEVASQISQTHPLNLSMKVKPLIYGTSTKDDTGNYYLVGQGGNRSRSRIPLLFRISARQ